MIPIRLVTLSLFIIATHISTTLSANPIPSAAPGGVITIDLGTQRTKPIAYYGDRRVMVRNEQGRWQAVIGINLNTTPGQQTLEASVQGEKKTYPFIIKHKQYETQHITLKTNKHVNLSKPNLDRHYKEKKRSQKALATWREVTPSLIMEWPLVGPITGTYGKRRVYNGQPRKPHSGIDIAAPKGDPIKAPLEGIVVETGNYFFNGNVIFIDHGQGLVTMFCHMSKILVKTGDHVSKGQTIAFVGASGRVTGPHLHWGVSLNGNMVDPQFFVPDMPAIKP